MPDQPSDKQILAEKLRTFAELACYSRRKPTDFPFCDPSDPENCARAERWLCTELTFLSNRDIEDLRSVWEKTIEDADYRRTLFTAVKVLQDKYANLP